MHTVLTAFNTVHKQAETCIIHFSQQKRYCIAYTKYISLRQLMVMNLRLI
jgi:hypothetical protein